MEHRRYHHHKCLFRNVRTPPDNVWYDILIQAKPEQLKEQASYTESFGQLVALGFDVAVFTPAPYRRHRL